MTSRYLNISEKLKNIIIIQRNNKRSAFHPEKIAIAIKKGFDSLADSSYNESDAHRVFINVIEQLEQVSLSQKTITIEEIQDTIEKQLLKLGYDDVYESFSSYRLRRSESRRIFMSSQHKFLKAIEKLSFQSDKNVDAMSTLLDYGTTISKEFARSYLIDNDIMSLHDDGFITIDDLEYYPLATTKDIVISIKKHLTTGADIFDYVALTSHIIQQCHQEVHGEVSIHDFDEDLSVGVVLTFQKVLINVLLDYQEIQGRILPRWEAIKKQIEKLRSIDDISPIDKLFHDDDLPTLNKAYRMSLAKTEELTLKAIHYLINSQTISEFHKVTSVNVGLSTSYQAQLVTKALIESVHESASLKIIFTVKSGVNRLAQDPNHELLTIALRSHRESIWFINGDAPFNESSVSYFTNGLRIAGDLHQKAETISHSRSILSVTYINLARLYLKQVEPYLDEITVIFKTVIQQLVDRFDYQCKPTPDFYPLLMEMGGYLESERLKPKDSLKKALRHGVLGVGIVGLEAYPFPIRSKIIDHLNKLIVECQQKYQLNFALVGINDPEVSSRFFELDQSIYGDIDNVYYQNILEHSQVLGGHLLEADDITTESFNEPVGFIHQH